MKNNALNVLVEDFFDKHTIDETDNCYDVLHSICEDEKCGYVVTEAIKEYAGNAFRSGFYAALSLMTGGVE